MSRREIERAHVMRAIQERRLTQKQAATQLALSVRQVERLFARYKRDGPTGLVSRQRGQRNHVLPAGPRGEALCIVRTRYTVFHSTNPLICVFYETIRMHPPVPLFLRRTIRECEIGEVRVPPDTMVCIPSNFIHRLPDW